MTGLYGPHSTPPPGGPTNLHKKIEDIIASLLAIELTAVQTFLDAPLA